MALGGGTFTVQNKILPGAYINFISVSAASATLSDRGTAAIGLDLDWGKSGEVFLVTSGDFQKNSKKLFGYSYTDDAMKDLREVFRNALKVYVYRLNGTGATKATGAFGTARYGGTRGNAIKIGIAANVDDNSLFDVTTYLGTDIIDEQTVAGAEDLVDNEYVDYNNGATLAVTAPTALTGGTNGTSSASSHEAFLAAVEKYSFNAIGYAGTDTSTKALYAAFTKRLRDEVGKKFQCVLHGYSGDYEGVINVKNDASGSNAAAVVYWVTGKEAGTAVNASATNSTYDGEYTINTDYSQTQLEAAIKAGEFTFHLVDDDVRVLEDINSLTTTTDTKGDVFKDNQTIRVIDQIGNDIAVLFNDKYNGHVPNDAAGRISLWADIVKHHEQLNQIRAIENFKDSDVTVEQGDTKKAVVVSDAIEVVNTMDKLYMTVLVA